MTFDICFVTYNSSKWLDNCIKSFCNINYDTKNISLYFTDNASTDETIQILERLKQKHESLFNSFNIIKSGENLGFGCGSNMSANAGNSDIVFFCNVDTEIDENAFIELEKAIVDNPDFDAFEMRQFPYEHPKIYNPITLEVDYASGACLLLKRELFVKTGGFDKRIFMYAEDVDLCYRIRLLGSKIKYVPTAILNHYAYASAGEEKPMQAAGSIIGNFILRAKYLPKAEFKQWYTIKNHALNHFKGNKEVEKIFNEKFPDAKKHLREFRSFYNKYSKNSNEEFYVNGFDYCFARAGSFYENSKLQSDYNPLISIIVRTFKRPEILEICLNSLLNQTYKNFEVVVCEDGENPCSKYVIDAFADKLNIVYFAMNESAGRCLTANKGIEIAKGEYINLLDDDDFFYPDHLEVVVSNIQKNKNCKMFVTGSVAIELDSHVGRSICFSQINPRNVMPQKIDLLSMVADNRMPIQAVTFHKSLAKDYGVFDNTFIDGYEDWELWTRYIAQTKCTIIEKATSLYCVPADEKIRSNRAISLQKNLPLIREKFKYYNITINATEIFDELYGEEPTKQRVENLNTWLELNDIYEEILHSNTWKLLQPLRLFFSFGYKFANCASENLRNLNDSIFGPLKFSKDVKPTPSQLNNFITLTQKSFFWKTLTGLFKKTTMK